MRPELSLGIIAAVSENGVIGYQGKMPWNLRADLRRFSQITRDATVIMGRKTWESIIAKNGKPLQGRTSIVLTRNRNYLAEDAALVAPSLEAALWFAEKKSRVFVIGGESAFQESLPLATSFYITEVHTQCSGDAFFPEFNRAEWRVVEKVFVPKDAQNDFSSTYYHLTRR